jgi:superfamily II DNA or RNA helicase
MSFRDLTNLRRYYAGQASQLVNEFYTPALGQATRYDRQSGYFDSASLVQAAAGLAAFLQRLQHSHPSGNGLRHPVMRLVTGATWSEEDRAAYLRGVEALRTTLDRTLVRHLEPNDEECIRLGLPSGWRPKEDQIAKHRFGVLAWMVATGLLEVRIALPLDLHGRPYYPGRFGALYHPKAGILYNSDDNIISFQGSVNETSAAWTRNREKFEVKRSWYSEQDREDIQHEIDEFEMLWNGRDPGLLVLPLPRAVEEHLKAFIPPEGPPERDAMDIDLQVRPASLRDRVEAQEFLEAPSGPEGEMLVFQPLWADGQPLKPFPHQSRVYRRAVTAFPQSFLFCDEVGLGKTIEAGLALRTLLLKNQVQRVLIITPRSLVRQWMEELREKFALTAWFFDGQCLSDVGGRVRRADRPWGEDSIVIVSRHLVARVDRMPDVLAAGRPWDLVVVDEAHAARRKVFGNNEPNLALRLLQELRTRRLFRCLWLLTATPMQLDPREVHDLLCLCGLDDPSWQNWADLLGFQGFFNRLQDFHRDKQGRGAVLDMTRIAVAHGAQELTQDHLPQHDWTAFQWNVFLSKLKGSGPGLTLALQQLNSAQAEAMTPYLARQTPLAVYMFRYTRATLRAYQERGMIHGLAVRRPADVPVAFRTEKERLLYDRIDELCRRHYRLADLPSEERSGVGFLMAVFRKRLASSFFAFQRSLERRRDLIAAIQGNLADLDRRLQLQEQDLKEDEGEDDDEPDVRDVVEIERQRLLRLYRDPRRRDELEGERTYLQGYIVELEQIAVDSKFEVFRERLDQVLAEGDRVLVFTQYVDTLCFIRERLVARYSDRIACYSGRGGEVWDPNLNDWRLVDKSEVKARSKRDHPQAIRILLGTDAASEGLNLQQFSAVINYDLPWNPMRVEQRIGRIDRIGQESPEVKILNLYMDQTIEEETYLTLKDRIRVFEEVVGPLQPILAEMPRIFRRLARGEIELNEARRLLEEVSRSRANIPIKSLESFVREDDPEPPRERTESAVSQKRLAAWCLAHPAPGMRIVGIPEPGMNAAEYDGTRGCLAITWAYAPPDLGVDPGEEVLATFNGELADRHPPTAPVEGPGGIEIEGKEGVRLLTWGDPYLTAWLAAVRGEVLSEADYQAAEVLGPPRSLV